MSLVEVRKFATVVEEVFHEGGPPAARPLKQGACLAVIRNPYAGRYVPDILPLMEDLKPLGLEMAKRAGSDALRRAEMMRFEQDRQNQLSRFRSEGEPPASAPTRAAGLVEPGVATRTGAAAGPDPGGRSGRLGRVEGALTAVFNDGTPVVAAAPPARAPAPGSLSDSRNATRSSLSPGVSCSGRSSCSPWTWIRSMSSSE